ncbi:hypothetical protein EKK58_06605 [Candidatus Dependentiae bacterium]|nr:MAG: hypothetical protein EKK58_06605 [Candidatus Dependentiae bacterium]
MIIFFILLLESALVTACSYQISNSKNPLTLEQVKQQLIDLKTQNPFFKKKAFTVEPNTKKSLLLERGLNQYLRWQEYQENPKSPVHGAYIKYKTQKYALQILALILQAPALDTEIWYHDQSPINRLCMPIQKWTGYRLFKAQWPMKELIVNTWQDLYSKIITFDNKYSDRLFNCQDAISISFLCAFLADIAYKRPFNYITLHFSLLQELFTKSTQDHNNLFFWLVSQYKEPIAGAIDFDRLKKWYGNKQNYMYPIFNKKGTVGISLIIRSYCERKGPVGFGREVSTVHNNFYKTLTDTIFHDILHFRVPLRLNLGLEEPKQAEILCKLITINIVDCLTKEYKTALYFCNKAQQQDALKCILSLFFFTHECNLSSNVYASMYKPYTIERAVKEHFMFENGSITNSVETFFQAVDMLYLYAKAYPKELGDCMTTCGIEFKDGRLCNINSSGDWSLEDKIAVCLIIQLKKCMVDAFNLFHKKYAEQYKNTLPLDPALII